MHHNQVVGRGNGGGQQIMDANRPMSAGAGQVALRVERRFDKNKILEAYLRPRLVRDAVRRRAYFSVPKERNARRGRVQAGGV